MAYNGSYLIMIKGLGSGEYSTDYIFPLEWIKERSYKTIRSIQDEDDERDGNNYLHRNALEHNVRKIEFQLTRDISSREFDVIMDEIENRYTVPEERKLIVDMYIPEQRAYTGEIECYIPDLEITIKSITGDDLVYEPVRFAFIEY